MNAGHNQHFTHQVKYQSYNKATEEKDKRVVSKRDRKDFISYILDKYQLTVIRQSTKQTSRNTDYVTYTFPYT